MEEQPSSDIGWLDEYGPPAKDRRLYAAAHCSRCGVADVCGEHASDSACGDPSEYDPEDLHPATTSRQSLVQELQILPPPLPRWDQPAVSTAVTIANSARPGQGGFAISAGAVLRPARGEGTGRLAVLVGTDPQIHKFWQQRGSLGPELRKIGYEGVIAPAFSTWWRGTPLEGILSLNRSMVMVRELARHLPVIPTLTWRTGKDLRRWCEWLNVGAARVVAVHLGSRTNEGWRWNLRAVRGIRELLPDRQIRLVAIGPSTVERISAVAAVWGGKLTVMSQRPWQLAQQGRVLTESLTFEKNVTMLRSDLAVRNAETFGNVAELIIKRKGLRAL